MGGDGRGRRGVEEAEAEEVWRFGGLEVWKREVMGGLPVDPDPHGVSVGPQPTEASRPEGLNGGLAINFQLPTTVRSASGNPVTYLVRGQLQCAIRIRYDTSAAVRDGVVWLLQIPPVNPHSAVPIDRINS
jgi:hypothetical protein